MATITEPILLDSTGQDIVEALETIAENMGTSAGHTIQNDSGTDMQRRDKLQFKGVYVEDDQTNDVTKVDICRTMTKAQMEALSGEALKGFINTSDEPNGLPLTAEWVAYDSNTSVKDKIDGMFPKSALKRTNETVTTFSDGAFAVPNINPTNQILLNIDGVGMLFMFRYTEQNQYVGVAYNNNLQPISSQSINIRLTYIDLSEY